MITTWGRAAFIVWIPLCAANVSHRSARLPGILNRLETDVRQLQPACPMLFALCLPRPIHVAFSGNEDISRTCAAVMFTCMKKRASGSLAPLACSWAFSGVGKSGRLGGVKQRRAMSTTLNLLLHANCRERFCSMHCAADYRFDDDGGAALHACASRFLPRTVQH